MFKGRNKRFAPDLNKASSDFVLRKSRENRKPAPGLNRKRVLLRSELRNSLQILLLNGKVLIYCRQGALTTCIHTLILFLQLSVCLENVIQSFFDSAQNILKILRADS